MPLNLSKNNYFSDETETERKNKIIKIEDNVIEKKKIKGIGLELVQMNRRTIRKPE